MQRVENGKMSEYDVKLHKNTGTNKQFWMAVGILHNNYSDPEKYNLMCYTSAGSLKSKEKWQISRSLNGFYPEGDVIKWNQRGRLSMEEVYPNNIWHWWVSYSSLSSKTTQVSGGERSWVETQ